MTIKFYYNGIKVDDGKLVKCWYSIDDERKTVTISAKDYQDLPRNIFDVVNETDLYTDYFDDDRTTLTEEHPLYKFARYAALKARKHDDEKHLDYYVNKAIPRSRTPEVYADDVARTRARIAAFDQEQDPGQPTAEDLEKIDQHRQAEENTRREAEQAEEQRRQEDALIQRVEGGKLIEAQKAAHPIKDGEPTVLIHWSEHPAFYDWKEDELILSVAAADRILGTLDMQEFVKHRGYYKTKFTITGTDPDSEPLNYTGRYDLGDGERGLIRHIHNFGSWYLTHDDTGHELKEPLATNSVVEFAAWLKQFAA